MGEFRAILLEGIFYLSDAPYPDADGQVRSDHADLLIQRVDGVVSVYRQLKPFIGERVYTAFQHVPDGINPARWGGGSCFWQTAGQCPFGHHLHPTRLLNLVAQGVLGYDLSHATGTGGWWVDGFDGSRIDLPLATVLPGHRGRIACATAMSVEEMRDAVMAQDVGQVEDLANRATDLRDLLARLQRATED